MSERRPVKRKKKIRIDYRKAARALTLLVLLFAFLINLISAAAGAGTGYDRDLIRETGSLDAEAPKISAKSAAMYSIDLDQFVYEKNADERLAPYSMTKILTCYLALENLDPDQTVTASRNAVKVLTDGTEIYLKEGEECKALDLIYASMMMSANDAATALGEAVSGSESAFADLMNETVKGWGCENTHFVNANGWDDEDHYTTAREMALIAKRCLESGKLRQISVTKTYTMSATNMSGERLFKNALLKATGGLSVVTGGKTGSWSKTQCDIAMEFTEDALSSVIVLMEDTEDGREDDPVKLVKFAHKVTPGFIVTDSDKGVCRAWVKCGARSRISLDVKGRRYAYPKNQKAGGVRVKTEIDKIEAPVSKGDRVGKYYIYANDEQVGQGYLYAGEDVKRGMILSRFYVSDSTGIVAAVIILLLIAFEILTRRR